MAGFTPNAVNLVPNLGVMATMGLIFGANIIIIRKYMVQPYLKLREKRDSLTSGSQEKVKLIREQMVSLQEKIDTSIKAAVASAKQTAEQQRLQALQQSESMIHTAKLEAAKNLKDAREKIAQKIIEQRTKLPKQINDISDLVYQQVIS